MNPSDHRSALALQPVDQIDVPQRLLAIHHRAKESPREIHQFRLASRRIQLKLENVSIDIEVVVELPGRMADSKWIRYRDLLVSRQRVHLRVDHCNEPVKRNLAVKHTDAANVHWCFLLLEIEEACVHRGEPVI